MTTDPTKSTPHGEIVSPPGFAVKKYRVLISFIDDDDEPVWSEILAAESMSIDYDEYSVPEMTLRLPMTSQSDASKRRPTRFKAGGMVAGSGITVSGGTHMGGGSVSPSATALAAAVRAGVVHRAS